MSFETDVTDDVYLNTRVKRLFPCITLKLCNIDFSDAMLDRCTNYLMNQMQIIEKIHFALLLHNTSATKVLRFRQILKFPNAPAHLYSSLFTNHWRLSFLHSLKIQYHITIFTLPKTSSEVYCSVQYNSYII